jgi:hypothetical protein
MKKPSAALVKATWDATVNPSAPKVAALLAAKGFGINYKAVQRLKKENWAEPSVKKAERALVVVKKAAPAKETPIKPASKKEVAEGTKLDITALVERRLKRIDELYLRSVAQNQTSMQQAGLIAGIVVAEELAIQVGPLTLQSPGDVAKLLHAITEATQVKHVGGEGQAPESGDPRVIEHEPVKTEARDAVAAFRKSAGL